MHGVLAGKTGLNINNVILAEEVRFELTGPFRAHRFSRPAHSATLPLLRSASRPKCIYSGKVRQKSEGNRCPEGQAFFSGFDGVEPVGPVPGPERYQASVLAPKCRALPW
jgi:hypothetical protein